MNGAGFTHAPAETDIKPGGLWPARPRARDTLNTIALFYMALRRYLLTSF
jgi:hypothetical protein